MHDTGSVLCIVGCAACHVSCFMFHVLCTICDMGSVLGSCVLCDLSCAIRCDAREVARVMYVGYCDDGERLAMVDASAIAHRTSHGAQYILRINKP